MLSPARTTNPRVSSFAPVTESCPGSRPPSGSRKTLSVTARGRHVRSARVGWGNARARGVPARPREERSRQLGRRIPIRAKVAAALAVPLVALVVGAGIGVSTSASQASTVTRQAELTVASIGHAGLINTLQDERNAALIGMLGLDSAIDLEVASVGESRDLTDASHHALHAQIAGEDDTLREDYAEALALLDRLPAVRGRVDAALEQSGSATRETAHEVFGDYTDMLAAIFASHDRFSLVVDDAGLRQGDDLVHYSSHATDAVAQLAAVLIYDGTGPAGIDQPIEAAGIAEYAAPAERLLANDRVIGLSEFATQAIADGGPVEPVAVLATTPLGPAGGVQGVRGDLVD